MAAAAAPASVPSGDLRCLRVKIRGSGVVRNNAVCRALGVDRDGHKDVMGLWIEQTEGAGFWLRVITELKSRGVDDILVALVDGLVGFPEAITTVFPGRSARYTALPPRPPPSPPWRN